MTAISLGTPSLDERTRDETVLRQELLDQVKKVRDVLTRTAPESEEAGFLVPEAVDALCQAGLLRMHVPSELGGHEASMVTQMLVLAALTEIDAAAGWNTMVNNHSSGFLGVSLPDEALAEVFADGEIPIAACVVPPMGRARAVDGGYLLTGRWKTCSGVTQASWLRLTAAIENEPGRTIFAALPKADVTVHQGSWQVFGLRGTGSFDVSVQDYFVPAHRAVSDETPLRGGAHYRLRDLAAAAYEHTGIALGLGRRALSEMTALAARKGTPRESLLTDLGRLTTQLEAATALAIATYERIQEQLVDRTADVSAVGQPGQAVATHATQVALECIEAAYRSAGTAGLYLPNPFERLMRDAHGASQHVAVSPGHYTELGRRRVAENEGAA